MADEESRFRERLIVGSFETYVVRTRYSTGQACGGVQRLNWSRDHHGLKTTVVGGSSPCTKVVHNFHLVGQCRGHRIFGYCRCSDWAEYAKHPSMFGFVLPT